MAGRDTEDGEHPARGDRRKADFDSRLHKARLRAGLDAPPADAPPPLGLASYALRLATELLAGIIVGGFLGWWIDRYFGTKPFGLILLLLLGFGAGMWNVVRAVQRMNAQLAQGKAAQGEPADDDENE